MGSIKNRAICDADCNAIANAEKVKEQTKIIADQQATITRLIEERDAAVSSVTSQTKDLLDANSDLNRECLRLSLELDRIRQQEQEGRAARTTLINASTAGEPGTIAAALKVAGFYDLPAESDREWESSTARDVRISDIDNEAA